MGLCPSFDVHGYRFRVCSDSEWALDGVWWAGVALGVAMAIAATLGDLTESLLKRDIGVKDMGSLLPGHGGVMDRLDSIALSAPVAWLMLSSLVPVS